MNENNIKKAYKRSQNIYDDTLTRKKLWSRLYIRFFWDNTDDLRIAERVLSCIPDDFSGRLLDVPAGSAVFTAEKYFQLKNAAIYCLDCSEDMLALAARRLEGTKSSHIHLLKGDVGQLPFPDSSFDAVLSMNGFHAFPDKEKAFSEIYRVLKPGALFCGCFYIKEESRRTDFLVKHFLAPKGWFTPPFRNFREAENKLAQNFREYELDHDHAMLCFCARK